MTRNSKDGGQPPRRSIFVLSSLSFSFLHLRNPWIAAWWSAAFPGYGYILLNNYVLGYVLITWEYVINSNAKLNLAILFTLTGQFEKAKEVLNLRWLLVYVATEQQGVPKEKILAVPLDKKVSADKLFDTIYRTDGISLLDSAAALGTVFMLLGVI